MHFFKLLPICMMLAFSCPSEAQDLDYPKFRQYFETVPTGVKIIASDPNYPKTQKSCKTPCKLTLYLSPDLNLTAKKDGYLSRTTKTSTYPAGKIYNEPFMVTEWGKYRIGKETIKLTLLTPEQQKDKDIRDEIKRLSDEEYDTVLNSKNSIDCSNAIDAKNLSGRTISMKTKPVKFPYRAKTSGNCKLIYNLNAKGKIRDIRTQSCTNKLFELEARKSLADSTLIIDHNEKEEKAICGITKFYRFDFKE